MSFYNDYKYNKSHLYGVRNGFVNVIIDSNITEIEKVKYDIINFLDDKGVSYTIVDDGNSSRICISFENQDDKSTYGAYSIVIDSCNKDIYRIYPNEILYIAIEHRKSVLYLTNNKRIETYYHIDHWKDVLDKRMFAQPHYSYIVNLNYVCEVTKEFVTLGYGVEEYKVYTSSRKISSFKKIFMNYSNK